jgi:hypothetical protein
MKEVEIMLLALVIVLLSFPLPAKAVPSLTTDQFLYTIRDKQVTLAGSGLSPGQQYYLWVRGPAANKTRYTGLPSFTPVSGGLIPPDVTYPLAANASLGTYLISLSTSSTVDNTQATAHFGVWGSAAPVYQRTQSVNILGGGIFPGTSLSLTIQDPAGNIVHAILASTTDGDFNHTWRIPPNAITDVFTAVIYGTGTFDNPQQDFSSTAKFTVTPAVLSATIVDQPNSTYQRTQVANVSMALRYPDGSPVVNLNPNSVPVILMRDQATLGPANMTLVDPANGIWTAGIKLFANATPSAKYRFEMPATTFDDGFGNKGAAVDTYSSYFTVTNASLVITSQVNGTSIQIPFGQVSILSRVTYPDGTPLTAGSVDVVVSTGSSVTPLMSTYDPSIGEWRASYSSTLFDLIRGGTWTLKVSAADSLGNSGKATYEVVAQPYLFISLIVGVVAVAFVVRWSVSRYGRKIYFRLRRILRRPRYRKFSQG